MYGKVSVEYADDDDDDDTGKKSAPIAVKKFVCILSWKNSRCKYRGI
jgi:hypothetical protein